MERGIRSKACESIFNHPVFYHKYRAINICIGELQSSQTGADNETSGLQMKNSPVNLTKATQCLAWGFARIVHHCTW